MSSAASPWTDDEVDQLKMRWSDGETCSEIGGAMGKSRNAVIGKVHRLGLDGRKRQRTAHELELAKRRHAEQCIARKRNQRRLMRDVRAEQMQEEIAAMPVYEGSLNIPFADLRDWMEASPNQCRFIADEPPGPEYRACGNETSDGESYCAHCKRTTHAKGTLTQSERAMITFIGRRNHLRALRHIA